MSGMFGSKQGPETNSNITTNFLSSKQKKYFNQAMDLYGPELGQNNNVYQGQRVAPFSDLQNKVFDFANNGGFNTSQSQTNDYFKNTIKDPATKSFNESTMPAVKEAFSGPGYWGSARAKSEVKANKDLNDYLNTANANLNWNVQQANKAGAQDEYALGQVQQSQQQNELNAKIQKFAEDNQITDPTNLSIIMSLLGMKTQQTSTASQSTTTPSWHTGDWLDFGTKALAGIL
jgi:hypothetical protein